MTLRAPSPKVPSDLTPLPLDCSHASVNDSQTISSDCPRYAFYLPSEAGSERCRVRSAGEASAKARKYLSPLRYTLTSGRRHCGSCVRTISGENLTEAARLES